VTVDVAVHPPDGGDPALKCPGLRQGRQAVRTPKAAGVAAAVADLAAQVVEQERHRGGTAIPSVGRHPVKGVQAGAGAADHQMDRDQGLAPGSPHEQRLEAVLDTHGLDN
jgi:hypothetical protein